MNGAQITVLILYALSDGIALAMHGKPKEGKYNFFSSLIGSAIMMAILAWGGFWA